MAKELELTPIDPQLVFPVGMQVEWDDEKDAINRQKHGYLLASVVDWLERTIAPAATGPAPTVWLEQIGRDDGEQRFRMLSVDWEGNVVDFVFTVRNEEQGSVLRIISYRLANAREEAVFFCSWSKAEVAAWLKTAYPPRPDAARPSE